MTTNTWIIPANKPIADQPVLRYPGAELQPLHAGSNVAIIRKDFASIQMRTIHLAEDLARQCGQSVGLIFPHAGYSHVRWTHDHMSRDPEARTGEIRIVARGNPLAPRHHLDGPDFDDVDVLIFHGTSKRIPKDDLRFRDCFTRSPGDHRIVIVITPPPCTNTLSAFHDADVKVSEELRPEGLHVRIQRTNPWAAFKVGDEDLEAEMKGLQLG